MPNVHSERAPDPHMEHDFTKRLLARSIPSRIGQLVTHPGYSLRLLKDRWFECRHPDLPLLTPGAIDFLIKHIAADDIGFEWGSGASTIWFGRHCRHLVSIEDVQDWHGYIATRLNQYQLSNVDLRHVHLEYPGDWPPPVEEKLVQEYIKPISDFADRHFDFVLVDGHYRLACVQAALGKVKAGGLLIVDDTHWSDLEQYQVPAHWPIVCRKRSALKETTIWEARA